MATSVLSGLASRRLAAVASDVLRYMQDGRVEVNVFHCSAVITAGEKAGKWQLALSILLLMPEMKVAPNEFSYSAAISASDKSGQWQQALSLLGLMPETKVVPNEICYNCALSAFAKGRQWQLALALLEQMTEMRVLPDKISFSAAISACEKGGRWQLALGLLSQMQERQLVLDQICCSAAISACSRGGQWQLALELLGAMPDMKIPIDGICYNSAISACSVGGRWQLALGLLSEMPRVRVIPDRVSYNSAISACERCGNWQLALDLLRKMSKVQMVPDTISYNSAISACSMSGQWQMALDLVRAILANSISIDQICYSAAITACEKGGHWPLALGLLGQMQAVKLLPDAICYVAAMAACEKAARWQLALSVLAEMISKQRLKSLDLMSRHSIEMVKCKSAAIVAVLNPNQELQCCVPQFALSASRHFASSKNFARPRASAPECLESVDEYLKPAGTSCSGKLFAAPPTGKGVDLECLDDGGAESLFSSPGRLRQELAQLDWVCDECDELQVHAFGSLASKDALASFLEEAAVARAKAAIEAMDAEERASAAGLLAEALAPGSRVDFPCVTVTEICQRVADRPAESRRGMDLLFSALAGKLSADKATHQDARRRKLKALTIAHELLYDENVLQEFASRPLEPLILLESLAECSGLGEQAEETIRMLASEVRRRVEAKVLLAEEEETIERSVHRAVTWAFPIPLWDGEGQGSMRGRTGAEALAKHLRRWGSWNRWGLGWGSSQEQLVLGDVRGGTFQKLVATLARLHEEQLKQIAPLLLAASDVHVRAVTWGEAVASAQHRSSVAATVLGAVTGATKSSLDSKLLSDFLEEALAASDELKRRCYRFAAVRNEAVERAQRLQLKPQVSYNAAVNACEKGRTWERAIGLVQEMLRGGGVAPDIITFNSAISACEKAQQWEIALSLVAVLTSQGLSPDRVTFNA
ncbi:unnamed protein product, partial [Polarella glacialis]